MIDCSLGSQLSAKGLIPQANWYVATFSKKTHISTATHPEVLKLFIASHVYSLCPNICFPYLPLLVAALEDSDSTVRETAKTSPVAPQVIPSPLKGRKRKSNAAG
jgi:hypothetical protein